MNEKKTRCMKRLRQYATIGQPDQQGRYSLNNLLKEMKAAKGPFADSIAASACMLEDMGENERGSVLSTLRRNTALLSSILLQESMKSSDLVLEDLKLDETGATYYLVLPEWRFRTHSRWLRMVISILLQALERTPNGLHPETGKALPAVLLILEEFASLGRMESIERAAGYIAGFNVKLWTILQDLNQLKRLYPGSWETFLGNSGVLTAFGNIDTTTTEYVSRRSGQCEISRMVDQRSVQFSDNVTDPTLGHTLQAVTQPDQIGNALGGKSVSHSSSQSVNHSRQLFNIPLITPDEVARHFAREQGTMLVQIAGAPPLKLERLSAHQDDFFKARATKNPFHMERR